MTANLSHSSNVGSEAAYVDLTNIEKKIKGFAEKFLVRSEFYEFDEPTFVELISKGNQTYLLSNELKFTRLLYICYSPEFKAHVFKGMPTDVVSKLQDVEFYVRIVPTSSVKLKHVVAQDTGLYRTKEKIVPKYKQKKKGITITFLNE